MILRATAPRRGTSLMEVIVSAAILLGTLAALGSLLDTAGDMARDVEYQSVATQLAESKMAEVSAGIIDPNAPAEGGTFEASEGPVDGYGRPLWEWTLQITPVELSETMVLHSATVTVSLISNPTIRVTLSKMILDLASRGTTLDEAKIAGSDEVDETTTDEP